MVVVAPSALAAKPAPSGGGRTTDVIGNDISWPQCGKSLPAAKYFGVIGVNGGLANDTNACLANQLAWARAASGTSNQPKVQLYVNTANPGGLGTASWPSSNVDPSGNVAPNPYGSCDNSDSLACAWQYGWNRAVEDHTVRFAPAAQSIGMNADPAQYTWWLDVETGNTWKTGGTSFDYASNTADLEGMTAYLDSVGAKVGLYSTAVQWGQIVGTAVSGASNLNGLDNWRPSGSSLANAKSNCTVAPLTTGGRISLTQYVSKGLDYDYSCIG